MKLTENQVLKQLKIIQYPGKKQDIVSLNMVKNILIEDNKVSILLDFPQKSPFEKSLIKSIEATIKLIDNNLGVFVEVVKNEEKPKKEAKIHPLDKVKNIIAVASGKGGVGKSTISANLAIALANTGAKVGILDADIYGPSIPKMFGIEDAKPEAEEIDGIDYIHPIEKYNVKVLSIGFFVDPENPLIWRGAMATNALKQFINNTLWGDLDYLIFDLPPGTGDIHLTMVQGLSVTGSIVVSTPQDVALADAIKGINMFKSDNINVPLLGLIENMSWFTPEELPDNKYYIFGKEGCKRLAEERNIKLLGQIPIVQGIREGGDLGNPIAINKNSIIGKAFAELSKTVKEQIDIRNNTMARTKRVEMTH